MYTLIFYFLIYSFLGWCVEVAYAAIRQGKFVNRGFLNGPVCPIYGFGVVLIYLLLMPIKENLILLFISSVIVTSILELVTGFVLEKLFHHKWWDYSDNKYNIGGYICLKFSLIWGVACLIAVKFIFPSTDTFISFIPHTVGIILQAVLLSILSFDMVVTILTIVGLNNQMKRLAALANVLEDNSEHIGELVAENTLELKEKYDEIARKTHILKRRLIESFPNMRSTKYNEQLNEIKKRIKNRINFHKHK